MGAQWKRAMKMTMMNSSPSMSEGHGLAALDKVIQESLPRSERIPQIPDRMYFRIGDVAEIAGLQPYVLRFWEKEFDFLAPVKNSAGQRLYRKSDVEHVLLIKKLLYVERFSIEGAKKRIRELRKSGDLAEAKRERAVLDDHRLSALQEAKQGLRDLIEFVG
jgi:DNA-binding transcriptional MerR regulator